DDHAAWPSGRWGVPGDATTTGPPAPTRPMREKKSPRPPDPPGPEPPRLGAGLRGRDLVESPGPARVARLGGCAAAAPAGTGSAPGRPGPQGTVLLRPVP